MTKKKKGVGNLKQLRAGGHIYKPYDAFETKRAAKDNARQARKHGIGPKGTKTLARVLYAGPDYRLKWVVYYCVVR